MLLWLSGESCSGDAAPCRKNRRSEAFSVSSFFSFCFCFCDVDGDDDGGVDGHGRGRDGSEEHDLTQKALGCFNLSTLDAYC